jgi:ZIP family zinc transporter
VVPIAAAGGFAAAGLAARIGCGCREHTEQASGAGTAAALAVHRFLEGSAIALVDSAAVALAVHAFGEGLATAALLGAQPRRVVGWMTVMSVSTLVGAAVAGAFPIPAAAEPMLLALAAGVITQAVWVSLRAAFHGLRTSRLLLSPTAAATMAAIITALAVRTAG